MSRSDLVAEYRSAIARVTPAYRRRLAELGLIEPAHRIGLAGVASVIADVDGLYVPDDAGEMAVVLPVWAAPISDALAFLDDPGRLIDLVAWQPKRGAKLLMRRGIGAALGEEAIRAAHVSGSALRLYRNPGSWARAGAGSAGAVILDWSADLGLLDLKGVVAEDVAHGTEVKLRLRALQRRIRRLPSIRVPIPESMHA